MIRSRWGIIDSVPLHKQRGIRTAEQTGVSGMDGNSQEQQIDTDAALLHAFQE